MRKWEVIYYEKCIYVTVVEAKNIKQALNKAKRSDNWDLIAEDTEKIEVKMIKG